MGASQEKMAESPAPREMNLYLSSYRIGSRGTELAAMLGARKHVAVVRNALDLSDDEARHRLGRAREHAELAALGITSADLDLRKYFGSPDLLRDELRAFSGLWVSGGNTFVLRRAMALSGLDALLRERVGDDTFTYAGYSAGACVLSPTLKGIHLADEPDAVPPGYPADVPWEGLGFVPFWIAPHYRSDHPESAIMEDVVEYYVANQMPCIALRDGEVHTGTAAG
jgi:dipeptidase E